MAKYISKKHISNPIIIVIHLHSTLLQWRELYSPSLHLQPHLPNSTTIFVSPLLYSTTTVTLTSPNSSPNQKLTPQLHYISLFDALSVAPLWHLTETKLPSPEHLITPVCLKLTKPAGFVVPEQPENLLCNHITISYYITVSHSIEFEKLIFFIIFQFYFLGL